MNKTIKIEGMMCMHCVKKVNDELSKVCKEVNVSLENKTATLKDTSLSDEVLTNIIEDLGYEVVGIANE